jgi:hypothetical protein
MGNFDQRYEQNGTDRETNPLLNSIMTNFQIPSVDYDVNEQGRRIPQLRLPIIPTPPKAIMGLLIKMGLLTT